MKANAQQSRASHRKTVKSMKREPLDTDALLAFFFEAGMLKVVPRSGWHLVGVHTPESVADHSFRTAVIAFVLAKLAGADAYRAACMSLFHDLAEARLLDHHAIAARYIDTKDAERISLSHSFAGLPELAKDAIEGLLADYKSQLSLESRVTKEADILERIIQAREYLACGYEGAADFMEDESGRLRTDLSAELAREVKSTNPRDWMKSP
jgi:putative hydrolases of HD superfamily